MILDKFLNGYPSVLFSPDGDSVFSQLRILLKGMSSHKEAKLLNYACRFLEPHDYYLEVGTYSGYTLCSAGFESNGIFVGIDNFSENYTKEFTSKKVIQDELEANLKKYVADYLVLVGDFRVFLMDKILEAGKKIGVLYVDGKHTYDDVVDTVEKFKPNLSDNALLVFDDTGIGEVRRGVLDILKDDHFEEIFYAKSVFAGGMFDALRTDPYIHNGFSMVTYRGRK